jgi:hypothetical protein
MFFDERNEILWAILSTCLWDEPHQLNKIVEKLEKIFPVDDESRNDFTKCVSFVISEAVRAGLIQKKFGFFILTSEGRKKVEVDHHSVFKNITSFFPTFAGV